MRRLLARLHRIWVTTGALVGVVFVLWSLLAYRASSEAKAALRGDDRVSVTRGDGYWRFAPPQVSAIGLLLFPGALVDPVAYAPLASAVAAHGHVVLLVEVPRRGAFGGDRSAELSSRYLRALRETSAAGGPGRWVVGGHSLGGVIASRLLRSPRPEFAGLVLIGTTHPRDFSLADLRLPVTQIFGTRDTVADVEKLEANRHNLPADTHRVRIDGGNHSQFASYGFQPGDWPATISRAEQQRLTVDAIVATLARTPR